ncbi:hypothetical protein PV433_29955 [Paenibacillus sp. GYB004]|uniref:hypothetical protein n=1 Tax=Paenibacillus sp. GYB004 TaxID=2994393 RepID=UPI002F961224
MTLLVIDFFSNNWLLISGSLILIGAVLAAAIVFLRAIQLHRQHKEYHRRFESHDQSIGANEEFKNRVLRYVSMHLQVLFKMPVSAAKLGTLIFLFLSVLIGIVTGNYLFDVYGKWDANLPYDQVGIGASVIIGVCACFFPFLLLHAVLQQRRATLSHHLLKYTEDFEKYYLLKRDAYAVFNEMVEEVKDTVLRNMTYSMIQALQSRNRAKAEHEIQLFEHQIGTRFCGIFCILLRESLGMTVDKDSNRRENKDIRVGIRSLIEKMHAIERVNHEDMPDKREIFQIGLATFPCLYGVNYITNGIMLDGTARKFLYEVPMQLNLFILAILLGFAGFAVNILISRRKFDL